MEIEILAFGIARDIFGGPSLRISTNKGITTAELLTQLKTDYPALAALRSLAIAVNATYAAPDQVIAAGDEVVLIPPVAGG